MITTGELVQSVRFLLHDMQGALVSDFEIVEAINRGTGLLFARMAEHGVQEAIAGTKLTVGVSGAAALPNDFGRVRWVRSAAGHEIVPVQRPGPVVGEYRIASGRLEAPEGKYSVEYFRAPPRVRALKDEVSISHAARRRLEEVVAALVRGDADGAEQAASMCCRELAGVELTRLADKGPVTVWGGRA